MLATTTFIHLLVLFVFSSSFASNTDHTQKRVVFGIQRTQDGTSNTRDCIFKTQQLDTLKCCLTGQCPHHEKLEKSIIHTNLKSESATPTANSQTADKEIRFENITARISTSRLRFLDVPKGDEMRIHNLRLEGDYLLFEVFSSLIAYLQPEEIPIDLLRDGLEKRLPFYLLAFQLIKTELSTFAWIIFWSALTLSIPFILLIYFCCTKGKFQRLQDDASEILAFRDKCIERTLTIIIFFFLILESFPIVLIYLGNEQISHQMSRSISTSELLFQDLETFVRNTHMQMSFVATSSTDITVEAIRRDLDDVKNLLGVTLQEKLAEETGVGVALEALEEIKLETEEVASLAESLFQDCLSVNSEVNSLQEELNELARALTIARQQCRPRERSLCYTLQYSGLDVVFSCGNLSEELKLKNLARWDRDRSFYRLVDDARNAFREIPEKVAKDAAFHVTELKNLLARKRIEIYKSAHNLTEISQTLTKSIHAAHENVLQVLPALNRLELWRWLSILGISTVISLIWLLLLFGIRCGCNAATPRSISLLLTGISLLSIICLPIWLMATISFLMGVHGQSLMCRPLYDQTGGYKTLDEILTLTGTLHKDEGLLKGNNSFQLAEILNNCQVNQPAFTTFHISSFSPVLTISNFSTWHDLTLILSPLRSTMSGSIFPPGLSSHLHFLTSLATLNFTPHRAEMISPLTAKDLASFSEQLTSVARQLTDATSAGRFQNLAGKVKSLMETRVKKLERLRNEILYRMTALEILAQPLGKAANRTMELVQDIEQVLEQRGWEIGSRNADQFITRLRIHLKKLSFHIDEKIGKEIGLCRPLWDIFNAARYSLCKLIINPTNGISISAFAIILLFLGIVTVALNLVEHYRSINEELLTSVTHRRARDGLIIDDEGTWATPSSGTPADVEARNNGQNEDTSWATPRHSLEPLIPQPPRLPPPATASRGRSPNRLSTIASRITAARVPQIPSVSRARSPKRGKHEAFKLIEPVCWKSGSITPKSWI